jgi:SAM-dependent methyltransferase
MNMKKLYSLCTLFLCGQLAAVATEQSNEEVFTRIYSHAVWGADEEGKGSSGGGATLATTAEYRYFLEDFFTEHDIKSVADIGCGYWEFSKAIDWSNIDYTGYDVVSFVIDANRQKYETPNIRFIHADVMNTQLPEVDLIICKDVLQHFSNSDIQKFLQQLPKCKYCLIINDIDPHTFTSENSDIECGGYHTVDLAQAPFSLPVTKVLRYWANNYLKQAVLLEPEQLETI